MFYVSDIASVDTITSTVLQSTRLPICNFSENELIAKFARGFMLLKLPVLQVDNKWKQKRFIQPTRRFVNCINYSTSFSEHDITKKHENFTVKYDKGRGGYQELFYFCVWMRHSCRVTRIASENFRAMRRAVKLADDDVYTYTERATRIQWRQKRKLTWRRCGEPHIFSTESYTTYSLADRNQQLTAQHWPETENREIIGKKETTI